jgi:hypothetical protein
MNQLLPRFRDRVRDRTDLLAALEYLEGLDAQSNPDARHDIESILHAADLLANLDPLLEVSYGGRPGNSPAQSVIADLASQMRAFIRAECQFRGDLPTWMKSFPTLMNQNPLWVFTTNYDPTLEVFCEREHIEIIDGFNPAWEPKVFDRKPQGPTVCLIKLHGSVLWFQVGTQWQPRKFPVYSLGPGLAYFDGQPLRNDPMIYPARTKDTAAQPFATLLEVFRRKLREDSLCIVIGYSFADAYLRRIVMEELESNHRLQIVWIDPAPWLACRATNVMANFRPNLHRFSFVPATAEHYLEQFGRYDPRTDASSALEHEDTYRQGGAGAATLAVNEWARAGFTLRASWFLEHRLRDTDRQHTTQIASGMPNFPLPMVAAFHKAVGYQGLGELDSAWAAASTIPDVYLSDDGQRAVGRLYLLPTLLYALDGDLVPDHLAQRLQALVRRDLDDIDHQLVIQTSEACGSDTSGLFPDVPVHPADGHVQARRRSVSYQVFGTDPNARDHRLDVKAKMMADVLRVEKWNNFQLTCNSFTEAFLRAIGRDHSCRDPITAIPDLRRSLRRWFDEFVSPRPQ